jgi:ribosomal protein S27AE
MPADKKKIKVKVKRRHKHCPTCGEIVPMVVIHEASCEEDLWWLVCSSCDSNFALTRREYQKEKKPDIAAIKKSDARTYDTEQIYSIGELIYHSKLGDIGIVMKKSELPIANCSGAVVVSFMKNGQKTLVEGYATA